MIEERCKDCSLFLVVEELKKEVSQLRSELADCKKELEKYKKPPKNSGNSSIPSSKDLWTKKYPQRPSSNLKVGGQFGHIGKNKILFDNVDEIISLNPDICQFCGCEHFIEKPSNIKKRQLVDIAELKPYVVEYQRKDLICANCKRKNKVDFPIKGNVELGENAEKLIAYFNVQHHVSYERIVQIFEDVLGLKISKGSVDGKLKSIFSKSKQKYDKILSQLKAGKIIGSDETGMRINKINSYLWTFQNQEYSYFSSAKNRGFKTIKDTIGEEFDGVWISDRLGSQLKIKAQHQICLSHLIRDCKYIEEAAKSKWAKELRVIFEETIKYKNENIENYNPLEKEYFREIAGFKKRLKILFKKSPPLKEEKRLYNQLVGRQKQLLLFLEAKEIPATNNASERALRNRVTKRKVSGCFRSEMGAYCNDVISSIIETAKKQKVNILDALSPDFSFA
jgi:transposase